MKSVPRAILCTALLLFGSLLFLIMNPLNKEVNVVGWELNTTRETSQYIFRNNFTAIIMPERVCDQEALLVIIVCTAPANLEVRNAIRETWGSERYILGSNISFYFLIGETTNYSLQNDILMESYQHGDIIQEHFFDSYNNLTLKSILMLKVATTYCINTTQYLVKIDDDMYLNVPVLVRTLLERSSHKNVLQGNLLCGARPIKDTSSKWYSPKYMYNGLIYPNYLSGTGYMMSLDIAKKLFDVTFSTPIFHLEDVYLTGICARKAHIKPQHHPMFSYTHMNNEPCEFQNLITIHHFTPQLLRQTFKALRNPNLARICEKYKAAFNSHNWLLQNILKPHRKYRKSKCE